MASGFQFRNAKFKKVLQLMYTQTLRASALAFGLAAFALPAAAENISVTITNNLSGEIREVYIDPVEQADWSYSVLDGRTISVGSRREYRVTENTQSCNYHTYAKYSVDGAGNLAATAVQTVDLCAGGPRAITFQ